MDIKEFELKIVDAKLENLSFNNSFAWQHVKAYQYKFSPFKVNIEQGPHKLIWIFAHIEIKALINDQVSQDLTADIFLKVDISIVYSMKDIHSSLQINNGKINNKDLISYLFETGFSTARGLVTNQTKGTTFHSAFLPIIDNDELFFGFEKIVPLEYNLIY